MDTFQIIMTVINVIAVIAAPIAAVMIAQKLQDRAETRKDKMAIFKTLMTARVYGWTVESVHALNVIDIVFAKDANVRAAWKDLYGKYCVDNPDDQQKKKIEQAQYKLLETIAESLGYKETITWETIQNPYIPKGMVDQITKQAQSQQLYMNLMTAMGSMVPGNQPKNGAKDNGST